MNTQKSIISALIVLVLWSCSSEKGSDRKMN